MKTAPRDVDAYLAALPAEPRAALEKLRKTIRSAAPKAEEAIRYGIPVFLQGGHLVGFGAAKRHCSFYPMSGTLIRAHRAELRGFETGKGTIRFSPAKPLPAALIRKLVKARLAENQS